MYQSRIRFVKRGNKDSYARVVFTIHSMERSDKRKITDNDIMDDIEYTIHDIEKLDTNGAAFAIVNDACKREAICRKLKYKNSYDIRVVTIINTNKPNFKRVSEVLVSNVPPKKEEEEEFEMPDKFVDLVKKISYDNDINHKKYDAIANKYNVSQGLVVSICNRRSLRVNQSQLKDLIYECLNLGADEKQLKNISNLKGNQLKKYIYDYNRERGEANNIKEDLSDIEEGEKMKKEDKNKPIKSFEDLAEALKQNTEDLEKKENDRVSIIDEKSETVSHHEEKKEEFVEEVKRPIVNTSYKMLKDIFDVGDGDEDKFIDPRKAEKCMEVFSILMDRNCTLEEIEALYK